MNFFETRISEQAIQNVVSVLRSGKISCGELNDQFEEKLKNLLGIKNLFTVNSGTSALHMALILAGIKPGDEVIIPSQTFIATGLAVLYCGAKVVFADINWKTGNIDLEKITRVVTSKTRAVIVVDWCGHPGNLKPIMDFANALGITVIEDAAHSLGATYKWESIGNIAHYTCFSFQATKALTTGDGGAVATLNEEDTERGKKLRWFGIDRKNDLPNWTGERLYNLQEAGYKYHLSDFNAAFGLGLIDEFWISFKKRQEIARFYTEQLEGVRGVVLLDHQPDRTHANWLFTMLVDDRFAFMNKMRTNGIPVSVVHNGIHRNEVFGNTGVYLYNQRMWDNNHVCLPCHPYLVIDNLTKIVQTIRGGW